jgi:hypothetical protein
MHTLLEKQQAFEHNLFKKLTRKARKMARSCSDKIPLRSSKTRIPAQQHQTKGNEEGNQSNTRSSFLDLCISSNPQEAYHGQHIEHRTQHHAHRQVTTDSLMLKPALYQESQRTGIQCLPPFWTTNHSETPNQIQEPNLVFSAFLLGVASAELLCGWTQAKKV